MKTKITLTVEIEHTDNTSVDTIKECLTTAMKETFWTDEMECTDVSFTNDVLKKRIFYYIRENDGISKRDKEIITDIYNSI